MLLASHPFPKKRIEQLSASDLSSSSATPGSRGKMTLIEFLQSSEPAANHQQEKSLEKVIDVDESSGVDGDQSGKPESGEESDASTQISSFGSGPASPETSPKNDKAPPPRQSSLEASKSTRRFRGWRWLIGMGDSASDDELRRRQSLGKNWRLFEGTVMATGRNRSIALSQADSFFPFARQLRAHQSLDQLPHTPPNTTAFEDKMKNLSPAERQQMIQVRQYIVGELLTTERNYVRNLEIVMTKFRAPLIHAALGFPVLESHQKQHQNLQTSAASTSSFVNALKRSNTRIHKTAASVMLPPPSPVPESDLGALSGNEISSEGEHVLFKHAKRENIYTQPKTQIIPLVDIKIMFSWIEDLFQFSQMFCGELAEVTQKWEQSEKIWERSYHVDAVSFCSQRTEASAPENPMSIGELFLKHAENWSVYLKFVDNYSAAKEAIRRSEENSPAYRQFITECLRSRECQRQGISDFLILPVQRVTRYVLLLQDLKKHTPPDHPEYENISKALEHMRKLANTVNEAKRREEEMTRMFHVVRSVEDCPPTIISAHRRILFEVDAYDVTREFPTLGTHYPSVNAGMSIVPSIGAMSAYAGVDGMMGNVEVPRHQPNASSMVRLFIFSDILVVTKSKLKKKKTGPFNLAPENYNSLEKLSLFRMAWLKDVEIVDLTPNREEPKQGKFARRSSVPFGGKFLIKLVLHNSSSNSVSGRRKFWNELANANTSELTSVYRRRSAEPSTRLTRSASQSAAKKLNFYDITDPAAETVHVRKVSVGQMKTDLEQIQEVPERSASPTTIQEKENRTSPKITANQNTPDKVTFAEKSPNGPLSNRPRNRLQRSSTIHGTKSVNPRTTSLSGVSPPSIATLFEHMSIDTGSKDSKAQGVVTITQAPVPAILSTSSSSPIPINPLKSAASQSLPNNTFLPGPSASTPPNLSSSVSSSNSSLSRSASILTLGGKKKRLSASSIGLSVRRSSIPEDKPVEGNFFDTSDKESSNPTSNTVLVQNVLEGFILEFPEKKQKNDLMLVIERLIREKRLYSSAF